jgi:exodeoxyribonuclease VII large subunit
MAIEAINTVTIQEYSVSEISTKIKNIVEINCGYVRIKGEISGLKIATSGHGYLNLKDDNAVLAATCWKHALSRLNFKLEDGMEVIASGKITTYAGQSRYQLTIDTIEPSGVGALMKVLVERKTRLEKEGLFDKSRKKALPFLPQRIGIITSITGAVIQDMLHRIRDRFPTHVLVWPVTVQGENAAHEISTAIDGFNTMIAGDKPEIIIVARGGGSIEDLWCFNEEVVVRSIASSDIPVISAVGHETDFTLSDFAADVRAPTPTAAAEFAVPVLDDLKATIKHHFDRLRYNLQQIISHKTKIMSFCENILKSPEKLIQSYEQKLDFLGFRILGRLPQIIESQTFNLSRLTSKIVDPRRLLQIKSLEFAHVRDALAKSAQTYLSMKANSLMLQTQLLQSLDYKNVLKRGFAIVKNKDRIVASSKYVEASDELAIVMHDGEIKVNVLR